jgi:chromatin assembly factor 1 subunit A
LEDRGLEKTAFLDNLRHELTCLLLSDLGAFVWSMGSQTDSWMKEDGQQSAVTHRLWQRAAMVQILSGSDPQTASTHQGRKKGGKQKRRSLSNSPDAYNNAEVKHHFLELDGLGSMMEGADNGIDRFSFRTAFQDLINRISDHVDPNLKLKAVADLKYMAQAYRKAIWATKSPAPGSQKQLRRSSLDPDLLSANLKRQWRASKQDNSDGRGVSDEEASTVKVLESLFLELHPETIFRDLQYISAFVSSQTLHNTDSGRAFLSVGLAALAWKDEVCRSMVDVADRIVARDQIKRSVHSDAREASIKQAADYWIIAAREGNAVAQRELASLYLAHPESTRVVSLPLALASDTFRREMMWDEAKVSEPGNTSQSLCLALHWMQLAAKNGDEVAQTKLRSRRTNTSIP